MESPRSCAGSLDVPESEKLLLEGMDEQRSHRTHFSRLGCVQWGFNIFSAIFILASAPILSRPSRDCYSEPGSPLNNIISFERQKVYPKNDGGWSGESLGSNEKWEDLVKSINIKATKEDYERAHVEVRDELLQTPDGLYVGVPAVMHDLHCVNSIRKLIHKPYHFPNMSEGVYEIAIDHADHCLDLIRRSLMCKPDISLLGGYWIADHTTFPSVEATTEGERTCVKWDKIVEWLEPRTLPRNKYVVLPGPFETQETTHQHLHEHPHDHDRAGKNLSM